MKVLVSLVFGAACTWFLVGDIVIDIIPISIFLVLSSLFYYVLFVHNQKDEVEILEEYVREPEDPV